MARLRGLTIERVGRRVISWEYSDYPASIRAEASDGYTWFEFSDGSYLGIEEDEEQFGISLVWGPPVFSGDPFWISVDVTSSPFWRSRVGIPITGLSILVGGKESEARPGWEEFGLHFLLRGGHEFLVVQFSSTVESMSSLQVVEDVSKIEYVFWSDRVFGEGA